MNVAQNPLTSAITGEVPLPRAPLIRVIAQVRFPQVLSIEKRDFVAPFQEAIRSRYPVLRPEKTQAFLVGQGGASQMPPQTTWRFTDVGGAWKVSLAPDFIALETTAYESREDFFARLQELARALAEHVGPEISDRVGVRYVDRVTGDAVDRIGELVRPEILGIVATPLVKRAQHALSDNLFTVSEGAAQLHARWGQLPIGGTTDPAAIDPLDEPSWILDLDMFRGEGRKFDADQIVAEARSYAERIYTFFRWAVTKEFLRQYGGDV
ncbi:MAG: TIGR04255 family protein [Bryobacteraceae bacterium]